MCRFNHAQHFMLTNLGKNKHPDTTNKYFFAKINLPLYSVLISREALLIIPVKQLRYFTGIWIKEDGNWKLTARASKSIIH